LDHLTHACKFNMAISVPRCDRCACFTHHSPEILSSLSNLQIQLLCTDLHVQIHIKICVLYVCNLSIFCKTFWIVILYVCNLSVFCKTFWIVIFGIPSCKLRQTLRLDLHDSLICSTSLSDVHGHPGDSNFSIVLPSLNWLNQCQGLCWWDDMFHLYGRNCAALLQWASV
jgi:hypothetical protein